MANGGDIFCWDGFELNPQARSLFHEGCRVKLRGNPFDVLLILVANSPRLVSKQEIWDSVWTGQSGKSFDQNLVDQAVSSIRSSNESLRGYLRIERGRGIAFQASVCRNGELTGLAVENPPQTEAEMPETDSTGASERVSEEIQPKARRWTFRLIAVCTIGAAALAIFGYWTAADTPPRLVGEPRLLTNSRVPKFGPLVIGEKLHRIFFTELVNGRYRVAWVDSETRETGMLPVSAPDSAALALSPDQKSLLVREVVGPLEENGPFLLQPLDGGAGTSLKITGYDGTWSPDGNWLAFTKDGALFRYSIENAKIQEIFRGRGDAAGYDWWPRFSPNGDRLRFSILESRSQTNSIWELDLTSLKAKRILASHPEYKSAAGGSWNAAGRDYFFQAGGGTSPYTVWWMPGISRFTIAPAAPRRLTTGPISFRNPVSDALGKHVYARSHLARSEMAAISLTDSSMKTVLPDTFAAVASYSPDGQALVYYSTNPEESLWVASSNGDNRKLLLPGPTQSSTPRWSPDGQRIALATRKPGKPWRLAVIPAGNGIVEELDTMEGNAISPTWTLDGQEIAFGVIPEVEKDPSKIVLSKINLATRKVSTLDNSIGLYLPTISPDGRYLAALSAADNYIQVMDLKANRKLPAKAPRHKARFLVWAKDSSSIVFVEGKQNALQIMKCEVPTMRVSNVRDLPNFNQFSTWIGLAPDNSFLIARDLSTQEIYDLTMR